MNYDNQDMMVDSIIQTFKSMTRLKEQLRYVLLILYQLDNEGQQRFQSSILKIEKYLKNIKFMRAVSERDGIVDEHPIQYFGRDYGYDDPYTYAEELEQQINQIELELLAILGMVIKHLKNEFHIGDEA